MMVVLYSKWCIYYGEVIINNELSDNLGSESATIHLKPLPLDY